MQLSWHPEPQSSVHGALEPHDTVHDELQLNVHAAPFAASDGRVQTHVLDAPGEKIVFALNRSWDTVDTRVDAPGGDGPWAPKEARILSIR